MKNFKSALIGSAAAVSMVVAFAASGAMAAPEHVKAGTLDCDVSGGVGLIIGSQKQMTCMFTPASGGRREVYLGTIKSRVNRARNRLAELMSIEGLEDFGPDQETRAVLTADN